MGSKLENAARLLGRLGGKVKSLKKAAAARKNGLKGGDPRKFGSKPRYGRATERFKREMRQSAD